MIVCSILYVVCSDVAATEERSQLQSRGICRGGPMNGDSSKRLKIILLNAPLLLVIILFSVSGIIYRIRSEFWSEMIGAGPRQYYNVLACMVIGYALIVSIGIIRMKEWGRNFALSLYSIVAVMFIGTKLLVVLIDPIKIGGKADYLLLWRYWKWYPEYGAGIYALIMIYYLFKKEVKVGFDKKGF